MIPLLLACTGTEPAPRPNLLLVTLDTTRDDHIGPATPNLAALAARGTRFERALAPTPITLPSHTTLMTGLEPWEHGVHNNGYQVPGELETLAEHLLARGWRTGAVIAATPLVASRGLDQGFEVYDQQDLERKGAAVHAPERPGEEVTAAALRVLEGLPEPWFLWVHYFDAHSPRTVDPIGGETPYQAEVRHLDQVLGPLLAAVDEQDLVVVTADHGEALGEHGEPTHGYFLHDATMRVPLLMAGPGVPVGQTVGGTARLSDLFDTLAFLLGQGQEPGLASWEALHRPAYGETWMPTEALGLEPVFSHTEWPLRLIQSPSSRLYDLQEDPGELRPLAGRDADVERMAGALQRRPRPEKASSGGDMDPALVALGYLDSPDLGQGEVYDNTALIQAAMAMYSATHIEPEELLAVLRQYPSAPELQQGGLALLAGTEHYDEALAAAAAALPDDANIQSRAALHWAHTDPDAANAALDRALAGRRQAIFTAMAGFAALELGRVQDAERLLRELDAMEIAGASALYDRARLRHRLGRMPEAVQDYERVVELEPDNAEAWRNLGYGRAMAGLPGAVEALEHSLELQEDPVARERLEQLRALSP